MTWRIEKTVFHHLQAHEFLDCVNVFFKTLIQTAGMSFLITEADPFESVSDDSRFKILIGERSKELGEFQSLRVLCFALFAPSR